MMHSKQNQHPNTVEINRHQREISKKNKESAFQWLVNTFPDAFFNDKESIKPLKVGIMNDILQYLSNLKPAPVSRSKLRQVVKSYASRVEYLMQLQPNSNRVGLDGIVSGTVSEEESEAAKRKVKRIIFRKNLRKKYYNEEAELQTEDSGLFGTDKDFSERYPHKQGSEKIQAKANAEEFV